MTDNTRLHLIDTVNAALASRNNKELLAARQLLQVKCHQSGVDVLAFLFDEVFAVADVPPVALKTDACPFCTKVDIRGVHGLKTHISRMHPEKFVKWKIDNNIK